jgi:hypothetical protein
MVLQGHQIRRLCGVIILLVEKSVLEVTTSIHDSAPMSVAGRFLGQTYKALPTRLFQCCSIHVAETKPKISEPSALRFKNTSQL